MIGKPSDTGMGLKKIDTEPAIWQFTLANPSPIRGRRFSFAPLLSEDDILRLARMLNAFKTDGGAKGEYLSKDF